MGTLVHRLFQRRSDPVSTLLPATALRLVRPLERVVVADVEAAAGAAAELYRRLRGRFELDQWLSRGTCHFEVPFSFVPDEADAPLVRGVMDCVIVTADEVVVIEIKTGRPRPEHEQQAAIYRDAARTLFGKDHVEVKILYA